jgi:hypothetical protein
MTVGDMMSGGTTKRRQEDCIVGYNDFDFFEGTVAADQIGLKVVCLDRP